MNKRDILIIEDDPKFRGLIKRALRNEGYSFFEAESVQGGIDNLNEHSDIKVILLDLSLPPGNGRDFLERIAEKSYKYRVIILTAHEEELGAKQARELSVFNYLPKALQSFRESLRFSVAQAFTDLERDHLRDKNRVLIDIQKKINTKILESSTIEKTLKALDQILTLICKSVVELVGAYTCHIRLYSLSKGELYLAAFAGHPSDEIKEIFDEPNGCLSGKVAKSKKPEIYDDIQSDKDFISFKNDKLEKVKLLNKAALFEEVEKYFETVQSAYITPITTRMFDDETDAVFNVSGDSNGFFSEERQEIIKDFVTLATTAITKAWQKKRKAESHQDYKGISEVLENISKELNGIEVEDNIYDKFLEGISEIIKPETISVFLYDEGTNLLENKAEFRGDKRVSPRAEGHPLDKGLTGRVFKDHIPIRIPNLQNGDRSHFQDHDDYSNELEKKYIGEIPSGRVEHYLGVPMVFGEKVIGVVQLINKKSAYYKKNTKDKERWLLERGFSNDCENVLGIAASHLAVSIRNAELFEERNRKIKQLDTLKDVGRYTSIEMPLGELLNRINSDAAENVEAEICLMFLINDDKSKVVLEQCYGIPREVLGPAEYKIGKGLTGEIAETGESALEEAGEPTGKYDRRILDYLKEVGGSEAIKSLMVVPIKAKGEILGVIKAINKKGEGEQYNNDDLNFFKVFASYVGIAIENAQRYELASKRLAAAESTFTLSNLISAVAHEFGNTYGHIPDDVEELRESITNINDRQVDLLDEITELTMEMLFFTNEISGYSLGIKEDVEIININEVITELIDKFTDKFADEQAGFRRTTNHNEISLKFIPSKQPLQVALHRFPLISTVRNIIINAYQALAAKETGEISIKTYKKVKNGKAVIEIIDNGCGIKNEIKNKIFDWGFTTKRGKTGKGSGLGLGLSKTHIKSLGGEINFDSVEDQGTKFFIELPLVKNES